MDALVPTALAMETVFLLIFFVTLPLAAVAFAAGAGRALRQIGKGQFAVEFESDLDARGPRGAGAPAGASQEGEPAAVREAEIRQLLEAKAYRQDARGEAPLDVERELEELLRQSAPSSLAADRQLREEVRQLVVARNERRIRMGKEPLDVDAEIERQLRDLENLGQ